MYQTLYLFTCRSTQMTQVWWLTQTSNLISCTQFNTMDSTVPFKSKLTVPPLRVSILHWIRNSRFLRESRIENREQATKSRESSLAGQKTKDSPMIDFLIILHLDLNCNTIRHRYMYIPDSPKRLYARNKTNSHFSWGLRIERQLTFERYCILKFDVWSYRDAPQLKLPCGPLNLNSWVSPNKICWTQSLLTQMSIFSCT